MILLTLLLQAHLAFAGVCAEQVSPGVPAWRIRNDPDFARIAGLLPIENDSEVRAHVDFLVRAFEVRARDEKLRTLTDPFLHAHARRVLAHLRKNALNWTRDNPRLVTPLRRTFQERAQRASITYRVLARNLGFVLREGRAPGWGTLFRVTWMAALLEDEARAGYHVGETTRRTPVSEYFALDVNSAHDEMRTYAQAMAHDPFAPSGVRLLEDLVDEADRLFATEGRITIPIAQLPSQHERLALAFLPLQWAPLTPPRSRSSIDHYLELSLRGFGYDVPLLRSASPLDWALGLNESWQAWFTLLGGEDSMRPALFPEHALRVVLFGLRFGAIDAISPDWSAGGALLRFLINEVAFTGGARSLHRTVIDYFWERQPHMGELYAPTQGQMLNDDELTAALDLAVVRMVPRYVSRMRDEDLRRFISRHPRDVVTTKLMALKALPKD